jgi:hypothetical protein
MKHRVAVTVSEPDHPTVTQRKEQVQKFVRVAADSKDDAINKAKAHYKKQGYKVHGAEYHSEIKEETELEELAESSDMDDKFAKAKGDDHPFATSKIGGTTVRHYKSDDGYIGHAWETKNGQTQYHEHKYEGEAHAKKEAKKHVEFHNEPAQLKSQLKSKAHGLLRKDRKMSEETELEEGKIDKEHPIVKEYNALKKHDIKTLRNLIKQQHRIVDTSGYTSKDHAISAYLRTKHGDKKVDAAFGFNEEVEQMNERESDPIPSVYSQGPHTKGTYHIDYVGKDKNGNVQKKTYKLKANDNHHAQSKAMKIARSEFDHVQSSANTSKFFKEEQLSFSDFIEEQSSCSKTAMIKKAVKKMKEEMNAELEENDQLQEEIEQLEEATIAYHVKKAEEAKGRGDDKKFAYHMENARTARFAMTGKEMMRNRHHLDKYNELRNAK